MTATSSLAHAFDIIVIDSQYNSRGGAPTIPHLSDDKKEGGGVGGSTVEYGTIEFDDILRNANFGEMGIQWNFYLTDNLGADVLYFSYMDVVRFQRLQINIIILSFANKVFNSAFILYSVVE